MPRTAPGRTTWLRLDRVRHGDRGAAEREEERKAWVVGVEADLHVETSFGGGASSG